MELLLVRHALPVRLAVNDGPADPPLAKEGHEQAHLLATYLGQEELHAVYTSPLRRAIETARPVADVHGVAPTVVDGLAEWDRHASEYVPVEELKATGDPRWLALVAGEWAGDETPATFARRVEESMATIAAAHRSEKVAVVCHGGVINAYLAGVLGLADPVGFFYPNYTSIHRVAVSGGGARSIITVNETAHLRGTGLPHGLFTDGVRR